MRYVLCYLTAFNKVNHVPTIALMTSGKIEDRAKTQKAGTPTIPKLKHCIRQGTA